MDTMPAKHTLYQPTQTATPHGCMPGFFVLIPHARQAWPTALGTVYAVIPGPTAPTEWYTWPETANGFPHRTRAQAAQALITLQVESHEMGWCPACDNLVEVEGALDARGIRDICMACGADILGLEPERG